MFGQSTIAAKLQRPPEDQSFYLNRPVVHPENFSGIWETSNGHRGAVGIQLQLGTTLSTDSNPPVWRPQVWDFLEVDVFESKGRQLDLRDSNGFSDSVRGGGVLFDNDRLRLHSASFDLDLLLQSDGCWHGRFHRGEFDSTVALCRPKPSQGGQLSPLAGTWSENSDFGRVCIHIAQTGPATFIGWFDTLWSGSLILPRNTPLPYHQSQRYGELAKVERKATGEVSIVFNPYSGVCCPGEFDGALSADGSRLVERYPPGLNQARPAETFTKVSGDSCEKVPASQK